MNEWTRATLQAIQSLTFTKAHFPPPPVSLFQADGVSEPRSGLCPLHFKRGEPSALGRAREERAKGSADSVGKSLASRTNTLPARLILGSAFAHQGPRVLPIPHKAGPAVSVASQALQA